jgi:hypothetical protein
MGRELELLAAGVAILPPIGFADRIMAAVALEPLPQPARAFAVALLAGRLPAAVAAVGDAWRVIGSRSTPLGVRAQALALALVVAIGSLAVVDGAAIGAIGLLSPTPSGPSPTTPLPSQATPSPMPSRSPSPSPSPTSGPSLTPSASTNPQETVGGTPSQEVKATPTPASTEPSATQRPRTPNPTATATDDHQDGSTPTPNPTGTDDSGSGDN